MHRRLLVFSMIVALTPNATHAACRADFNSNGSVEVNELIQAVNEALNGCGDNPATPTRRAPTPTRTPTPQPSTCPYKFNQAVSPDLFCGYSGDFTSNCDPFPVGSGWTTNGTDVLVLLIDNNGDSLAVESRRTSPTAATVSTISFSPNFDMVFAATGTVSLPSTTRLKVVFNAGGNCGRVTHEGTFFGLLGNNAQTAHEQSIADLRAALQSQVGAAAQTSGSDDRTARIRELMRALHH